MNLYVHVLMTLIILFFVVSGILLKSRKYSWLISGTMMVQETSE